MLPQAAQLRVLLQRFLQRPPLVLVSVALALLTLLYFVAGGGGSKAPSPVRLAPFQCPQPLHLGPWNTSAALPACFPANPTQCEGPCLELLRKIQSERVRQAWPAYYADIAYEVDRRGVSEGVFLEVGTAFGGLAQHLLRTFPRLRVVAVDPFFGDYDSQDLMSSYFAQLRAQYGQKEFSKLWAQAMAYEGGQAFGCRYSLVNSVSKDAARHFPPGSLDMVFVDGDHTREGVETDIATWQPVLKVGRSFLFNDYQQGPWPGVVAAVNALAESTGQPVHYLPNPEWGNVALFNLPLMCKAAN